MLMAGRVFRRMQVLRVLPFYIAFLSSAPAYAQYVEPEIEVQKLSEKAYPAVAEDEASIMNSEEFYKLRNKVFAVQEIAVVRIVFKGQWYKTADYLAREKAALLGANALVLVESVGREDLGAGAIRTYRAFQMTNSSGRTIYMKPAEESPLLTAPVTLAVTPIAAPKPSADASSSPSAPRRTHRHFDWVWTHDASILTHRLGFNAARASKDELEQLKLYVRENFPAAQSKKLAKAYDACSRVTLDFIKGTVE